MSRFSTNETAIFDRIVDVKGVVKKIPPHELQKCYELDRCVNWIKDNNLNVVCLQFPDSQLVDSVDVALFLEKELEKQVYILGDTSYGSCCVDEVASQHINADGIIHFGPACLSPTKRMPVLYIFEKKPLEVDNFISQFRVKFVDSAAKLLLLYELGYHHCIPLIKEALQDFANFIVPDIVYNSEISKDVLLGRNLNVPGDKSQYTVVYLGHDGPTLTNFALSFPDCKIYVYDPIISPTFQLFDSAMSKYIMKRMYLVEKVKDAKSVGILIGTLSVSSYLEAIDGIKALAKQSGKKSYIVAIGKPNIPKLANMPEIDVFVLLACPINTLLDYKGFYRPVVTPYEVAMACNKNYNFTGNYIADFQKLIPELCKQERDVDSEMNTDAPDVSLISGQVRSIQSEDEIVETNSISESVSLKSDTTISNISGAGEYFVSRSWKGLDPLLGKTEVQEAVAGRSGIPQCYDNDMEMKSEL